MHYPDGENNSDLYKSTDKIPGDDVESELEDIWHILMNQ